MYRLAVAPVHPHDDLYLVWVWTNYRGVISHESALALMGLSDLLPNRIHLTVPRAFRRETGPSYVLHYRDLDDADRTTWDGLPATTAARSPVDAAADGSDPEQVGKAIADALGRGLTAPEALRAQARRPDYKGRRLALPLIERELAVPAFYPEGSRRTRSRQVVRRGFRRPPGAGVQPVWRDNARAPDKKNPGFTAGETPVGG